MGVYGMGLHTSQGVAWLHAGGGRGVAGACKGGLGKGGNSIG